MKTTIDKAGRVVIPAEIRAKAYLRPGMELEVTVENGSIRLERKVSGPKLVRVGKLLIARPTVPRKDLPKIDVAKLIEDERNRWPF
jgi:AbrB family looped-hinge helix DNA binding protein